MIELEAISVARPPGRPDAALVLSNVSLSIAPGDWIVVTGANGSGKTTLLEALAGVVPLSSGRIVYSGDKPTAAIILQEPDNQFVASTVRDELLLSLRPGSHANDDRIEQALTRFSLKRYEARNPHRLSGGEKQRLAMASVWLAEPALLLLDEPMSYLDEDGQTRCLQFVSEMRDAGAAVVWADPRPPLTDSQHRRIHLRDGAIAELPPVPQPSHEPADAAGSAGEARPEMLLAADEHADFVKRPSASSDAVAVLENASYDYGDGPVFRGLSVVIEAREAVGICGSNGSGKSTLLGVLSGMLVPDRGRVELCHDRPVSGGRQHVFYLFQSPERLFFAETAREEIAFGLRSLDVPRSQIESRIHNALASTGLDPAAFLDRMPFTLSLGEMRRLAFAIAAALSPGLLLLDEPTSCLDDEGVQLFESFIASCREQGSTIVVASHDRALLSRVTDRVIEL